MSEVDARRDPAAPGASAATAPSGVPARAEEDRRDGGAEGSFGLALAAAREARGLSQSDVAAQLRLNTRQVQALEAEDFAALPEGPFVRGYVRNYARLVDLPPEPLLALLGSRLKPTDPLHGQGSSGAISPLHRTPREPLTGRIAIGGALIALALFAAFGWWAMREPVPEPPPAPAVLESEPQKLPEQAAEPAEAAVSAAPEEPATPAGDELRFEFRERSWVEVRQADGTVLMSQNNAAGTSQTVDGRPPYTLVIGNASKVDLFFRGQPVALAGSIVRDDVARLRLE